MALSFELNCDFIFVQTDDVRLINRLSSLRPKAYIIAFSNNPKVKNLVSVNFGVYSYPLSMADPKKFISEVGSEYGIKQEAKILSLESEGSKIVGSKLIELQ